MLTTERKACPPNAYIGVYCLKKLRKIQKNWQILNSGNITLPFLVSRECRFVNGKLLVFSLHTALFGKQCTAWPACIQDTNHLCQDTIPLMSRITHVSLVFFINFYNLHIIIYTQFCCLPYYLCSSAYTTDKRGGKIVSTPRRCRTKEQFLT